MEQASWQHTIGPSSYCVRRQLKTDLLRSVACYLASLGLGILQ